MINLGISGGQSPYTYLWNTNANLEDISGLSKGNYYVTVADNAGCTATDSASIAEPAPLVLTATYSNPTCESNAGDGGITLFVTGGTPPFQYVWNSGLTDSAFAHLLPGNYTVRVADASGCLADTAFVLAYQYSYSVQATPAVTIKMGESTTLGYTLTGNAGNYVNIWSPGAGLGCTDCTAPTASPNQTTLYKIEVKNDVGCIEWDTVTVNVIVDYGIYIPNVFTPDNKGNNDVFRIYGNLNAIVYMDVQIFDRWGELVFSSTDVNFEWDGRFKNVKQNSGVYMWQMKTVFLDNHNDWRQGGVTLLR
jgi:gliding motility-associated-like protein